MSGDALGDRDVPSPSANPRADALARYLRECAAAFSLSADATDERTTAEAGMALLDAAAIAAGMSNQDPRLRALSEAGLFESMPDDQAVFLPTPAIRAAVVRTLLSAPQNGSAIIARLMTAAASSQDQPPPGDAEG